MFNVKRLHIKVTLIKQINSFLLNNKCNLSSTKKSIPIKDIILTNSNRQQQYQAQSKTTTTTTITTRMIPSFESTILQRRIEARRSIYIQYDLQNKDLLLNILNDLENAKANINNVFYFRNIKYNAALIEFNTSEYLDFFLNEKCSQFDHVANKPIQTRSLFYRASRRFQKCKNYNYLVDFTQKLMQDEERSFQMIELKSNYDKMYEYLKIKHKDQFQKQILRNYQLVKLDELNVRARYFLASLIEDTLVSLFPKILCLPFGSSASNFGKYDSDLDLTIFLEDKVLTPNEGLSSNNTSNNFYFNTKVIKETISSNESERNEAKSNLALLLNIMKSFLPDFHAFESITSARVPIIKCKHRILADTLDIDISMNKINQSFSMTKLLWTYSMLDANFVPLVYFVKDWAKHLAITSNIKPNTNLSNYHLVLLVLNYLINKSYLPKLNDVIVDLNNNNNNNYTNKTIDINSNDDIIPIKDPTQVKFKRTQSNDDLIKLINDFFIEYSQFNFNDYRISFITNEQNEDTFIRKDKSKPIFIENPLMSGSNVALNVSQLKLNDFQAKCKESLNQINSQTNVIDFLNDMKTRVKASNDDHAQQISNVLNYQVI